MNAVVFGGSGFLGINLSVVLKISCGGFKDPEIIQNRGKRVINTPIMSTK